MSEYYNVTTNAGDAAIATAIANNSKLNITHVAFGDGNGSVPTPDKTRSTLVHEVHRQAITKYTKHPSIANYIVIETIIPSNVGGFWIREMGIIAGNVLISHGSHAPFFKVSDPDGVSEYRLKFTQDVRDGSVVEIVLDESLIYASQAWVNENYIRRNELIDNLTTDDATKPLTAKQGKTLQNNKLDKTENATSATKLQTPRKINNVDFDGTKNIEIKNFGEEISYGNGNSSAYQVLKFGNYNKVASAGYFQCLETGNWESDAKKRGLGLSLYSESGNVVSSLYITSSNAYVEISGTQYQLARTTDNVASATKLQNSRNIFGQSFDGTGNIGGNVITGGTQAVLTTATNAKQLYIDEPSGMWGAWDTKNNVAIPLPVARGGTGATDAVTARSNLGAVSANDNVASATKLQNPRKINNVDFDGTKNIDIKSFGSDVSFGDGNSSAYQVLKFGNYNKVANAGYFQCLEAGNWESDAKKRGLGLSLYSESGNVVSSLYITSSNAYVEISGTQYQLARTTDNVASATKLQNSRNIALSGAVSGNANFDGSGNITITTTANNAIGVGQSWSDVTSQRANNTTYTNTTGRPIQLFISVNVGGQGDDIGTFNIDGVVMTIRDAAAWSHLSFIIPNGSSYKLSVNASQYNLLTWAELR